MYKTKHIVIALVLATCIIAMMIIACMGAFPLMSGVFVAFGQDKVPRLVFANHSGQDVTITIHSQSFAVQREGLIETPFVDQTYTIRIKTSKGEEWTYNWVPLDARGYLFQNRMYLQIDEDGAVYLLPIQIYSTVQNLPSQPTGFPLKPRK
jgi:hypothetical protein